ncbi:MAG TPA: glycosyltransferase, partial [Candidatus Eisenbacteria bacterium]
EVGSGIRVRILEAMAWSLPVVSTTIGCEGIEVENGRHLLVADGHEQMANAINRLIKEPVVGQTLRREGRRLVEKKYSLEAVESITGRLYRRLAADPVDSAAG